MPQVREYLRNLAPERRRRIKQALAELPAGDSKALSEELDGLMRLRVGTHRLVFRRNGRKIEVFYAAPRSLVYEFAAANLKRLVAGVDA